MAIDKCQTCDDLSCPNHPHHDPSLPLSASMKDKLATITMMKIMGIDPAEVFGLPPSDLEEQQFEAHTPAPNSQPSIN